MDERERKREIRERERVAVDGSLVIVCVKE